MNTQVILIVGNCGVGKTWMMKQLIKKHKCTKLGSIGMFAYHRSERVMVLGKYDGSTFEGSDKLSMALMRDVELFKRSINTKFVICEGDRFMNNTFIQMMRPNLTIIRVAGDGGEGRKKRGSTQSERQLKSIATRVSKISPKHDSSSSVTALAIINEYIAGKR